MDDFFSTENQQTDFNSSIATLMRIDRIKVGLALATIKEDYFLKYKLLKDFFMEICPVAKKDEQQKLISRQKYIDSKFYELRDIVNKSNGTLRIPKSLLQEFEDWELELRMIEQDLGMNMKKSKDARFALASR